MVLKVRTLECVLSCYIVISIDLHSTLRYPSPNPCPYSAPHLTLTLPLSLTLTLFSILTGEDLSTLARLPVNATLRLSLTITLPLFLALPSR